MDSFTNTADDNCNYESFSNSKTDGGAMDVEQLNQSETEDSARVGRIVKIVTKVFSGVFDSLVQFVKFVKRLEAAKFFQICKFLLEVAILLAGAGAVGYGLFNLIETAQVPACIQPVDEAGFEMTGGVVASGVEAASTQAQSDQPTQEQRSSPTSHPDSITDSYVNPNLIGADLIQVELVGAVNQPGVYQLQFGQRLIEAVELAGGFSDQADREQIAQTLNLAQVLTDGQKFSFPIKAKTEFTNKLQQYCQQLVEQGQLAASSPQVVSNSINSTSNATGNSSEATANPSSNSEVPANTTSDTTCISVNSASAEELKQLPGIGEVRAADIIQNRPFARIDELLSKQVVGETVFDNIKTDLCL